jgi:hypothetical protein
MSIPKSAINPLDDLYDLIEKGKVTKTVTCRGKTYTFRSLFDEDYTWRDQFINMNGPMVMLSSQRSPTLAVATVAIDGVPVEQIPGLDEVGEGIPLSAREFIASNSKYLIAYNLHTKVYSKLPREYLEELYDLFQKEVELPTRIVSEEDIKNS